MNIIPYDDGYRFVFSHFCSDTIDVVPHLHDGFEIYYLISGDVDYFIEDKAYELKHGDLIITNEKEVHTPIFRSDKTYERIIIQFGLDFPLPYGSDQFDIFQCFRNREKGEKNRIALNHSQNEELLGMFRKIEECQKGKASNLDNVLKYVYLVELLILINKAYLFHSREEKHFSMSNKILPVIQYIANNLEEDLTLDSLARKFFINKIYLSRLFKKNTGINLHDYIVYKRLAYAKELLARGHNVTEVCSLTGFNDYSNFIRTFKKIIGMPPGAYKKA